MSTRKNFVTGVPLTEDIERGFESIRLAKAHVRVAMGSVVPLLSGRGKIGFLVALAELDEAEDKLREVAAITVNKGTV